MSQTENSLTADTIREALEAERPRLRFRVIHNRERDVFDVFVVDDEGRRGGPLFRDDSDALAAQQSIEVLVATAVQAVRKW